MSLLIVINVRLQLDMIEYGVLHDQTHINILNSLLHKFAGLSINCGTMYFYLLKMVIGTS
jgi:hypothetical protein